MLDPKLFDVSLNLEIELVFLREALERVALEETICAHFR